MVKKYKQYINEELNFRNPFKKRIINYSEIDSNEIDPYGEEIWDDDELTPILRIAKRQGLPYEQITELDCSNKGLTSLDGIENLINLRWLTCSVNNLTSLKGIENLKNLILLNCHNDNLTSLKGIENLTELKYLFCSSNHLTSLEGIENLRKLQRLYCWRNNYLTSLEGIENLTKLEYLYCPFNNFSDDYKQYLIEYCKKKKIFLNI